MDRFDILEGWYWALLWGHGGQGSESYERLCRLREYYRPGACASGPTSEDAWRVCAQALISVGCLDSVHEIVADESVPIWHRVIVADVIRAECKGGYTECLCRDCMRGPIMGPGLCDDCQGAGCADSDGECCVECDEEEETDNG